MNPQQGAVPPAAASAPPAAAPAPAPAPAPAIAAVSQRQLRGIIHGIRFGEQRSGVYDNDSDGD